MCGGVGIRCLKEGFIFILCVQVFCLHTYMCTMCVCLVPEKVRRVSQFPTKTGVTDDYELPCGHGEPYPGPLQEQLMPELLSHLSSVPHESLRHSSDIMTWVIVEDRSRGHEEEGWSRESGKREPAGKCSFLSEEGPTHSSVEASFSTDFLPVIFSAP